MSESFDRGRIFERRVASILRSKLGVRVQRDKRSGAGIHKADILDYYQEIPLHLEVKDQETLKIKEWFRQADATASFNQVATLVFAMDEEILCTLRFSDLVNFLVEIADQKAEIDDLRRPIMVNIKQNEDGTVGQANLSKPAVITIPLKSFVGEKIDRGAQTCKDGHISDQWGYCLQAKCKYSRGYKPPKGKKQ